jgi:hypothetical protein
MLTLLPLAVQAQTAEAIRDTLFKRLKVSGYVQAQFQLADTAGIETFSGGNFPANVDNRFSIRRGRIKFTYENKNMQYVVQLDATEKGVAARDVWVALTDPWTRCFMLTGGIFSRPFGYEIEYSSGLREVPERTRMIQTLFSGERDLGVRLTFQPPKTSPFSFIKADFSVTNGTGPNYIDFDRFKDYIGRISINRSNQAGSLKYGLGLSWCNGGWRQGTRYNYFMEETALPGGSIMAFQPDSSSATGSRLRKQYFGADAQVSFNTPIGTTQLRGEFITGRQPGTQNSSATPTAQPGDAYTRNFSGAYIYLIQNVLQSKFQAVARFDYYDPNTDVSQNAIGFGFAGKGMPTGAADIRYSTMGIGLVYHVSDQVKFTAYYDRVTNEVTERLGNPSTLKDLSHDRQDNLFTLRLQYRF